MKDASADDSADDLKDDVQHASEKMRMKERPISKLLVNDCHLVITLQQRPRGDIKAMHTAQ